MRTSLSVVNIGQGGIIAVGLVLVMTAAGTDIQEGSLSVGDFVAINTFLLQLYLPLNFLGWVYREIRQGLVDMERMFGLLNEKTDVFDTASSKNLKVDGGKIVFKDVCFDYDGRMVLNGVSLLFPLVDMLRL